ncbi:hypothetical protein PCL1606_45920 [Pseudomonas chlororaphis]|uniref:Uncharacterized protein n=1 Tax=Pseudomonas chlororaphis TaxID=587753 RepID=A0A0D5Y3U9_9PSED|nr:hypothetical protein PCL1606_45920 [Pseudomonas chlororaphis]
MSCHRFSFQEDACGSWDKNGVERVIDGDAPRGVVRYEVRWVDMQSATS